MCLVCGLGWKLVTSKEPGGKCLLAVSRCLMGLEVCHCALLAMSSRQTTSCASKPAPRANSGDNRLGSNERGRQQCPLTLLIGKLEFCSRSCNLDLKAGARESVVWTWMCRLRTRQACSTFFLPEVKCVLRWLPQAAGSSLVPALVRGGRDLCCLSVALAVEQGKCATRGNKSEYS